MFEIPDDENFWEELPLDDITNSEANNTASEESEHLSTSCGKSLRVNQTIAVSTPITVQRSALEQTVNSACKRQRLNPEHHTPITENFISLRRDCIEKSHPVSSNRKLPALSSPVLVPDTQPATPHPPIHVDQQDRKTQLDSLKSPTSFSKWTDKTPKRCKRKFPGPAGLLPKLGAQQSPDVIEVVKSPSVSPVNQNDGVLSSSQSEDVFNELPWQTLIKDLGNDGKKYLKQFSIASSLQKSKKKLLPRGKVPLVMAVVETLDWQGSEASVQLKDKSGKVNGTIHGDIMKEYQEDVQVNSVLVLRQVGVISPTARNHYLNITPSNIVTIYSNKMEGLKKVVCVNQSLCSVVESIQKDMDQELVSTMNSINNLPKTPRASAGSTGAVRNSNLQTPTLNQSSANSSYRFRTPQPDTSSRNGQISHVNRSPAAVNLQGNKDQYSTPVRLNMTGGSRTTQVRTPCPSNMPHGSGTNYRPNGSAVSTSSGNSLLRTPTTSHNRTPSSSVVTPSTSYRLNNSTSVTVGNSGTHSSKIDCTQRKLDEKRRSAGRAEQNLKISPPQILQTSEANKSNKSSVASFAQENVTYQSTNNTGLKNIPCRTTICNTDNEKLISNNCLSETAASLNSKLKTTETTTSSLNSKLMTTPIRNGFRFRSTKKSPNTELNSPLPLNRSNMCENLKEINNNNNRSGEVLNSAVIVSNNATHNTQINNFGVKFKPQVIPSSSESSEGISPVLPVQNKFGTTGTSGNMYKTNTDSIKKVPCFAVDSNWHDDLSDDLLSQLSEEMME